jgi:gluconokinase
MTCFITIMGVAGCGKSSLGRVVATAAGLPLIEGDDFHSPQSRAKMRQGIALTDADREGWLDRLGQQIAAHPQGLVLTCSALRRAYRDRLRRAVWPELHFVFLEIDRATAQARVAGRAEHHFFPATLVESQFQTLEPPVDEPGVLHLDATRPLPQLAAQVQAWLAPSSTDSCPSPGNEKEDGGEFSRRTPVGVRRSFVPADLSPCFLPKPLPKG